MSAISDEVRAFVTEQPLGVLATYRADGSVRQTVVNHVLDGETIRISTEGKRYKAKDVARDPRASFCVVGAGRPAPCATLEGSARIITEGAGAFTTHMFEVVLGAAPDEPMTDAEAAAIDRVILEIAVDRVYGVHLPEGREP